MALKNKTMVYMTIIQDMILAVMITLTATALGPGFSGITAMEFLIGAAEAFSINIIAGIIIPVERLGREFAHLFHAKEGTVQFKFLCTFLINAIFVTIISLSMCLIHNGFAPDYFTLWISTYPLLHLVGLITSLVIESPVKAAACKLSSL